MAVACREITQEAAASPRARLYSHVPLLQLPRDLSRELRNTRCELSRGSALGGVVNLGAPLQSRVFEAQVCREENKETSGAARSAGVYS